MSTPPDYVTISGLDDFPTAIALLPEPLTDGRRVMACVHMATPGTNEIAYAAAYFVDPLTWHATLIGRSKAGKVTAVALTMRDTVLEMWPTEPPPHGSGTKNEIHRYAWNIGVRMDMVDGRARDQANDATDMIHATNGDVTALEGRVEALEA